MTNRNHRKVHGASKGDEMVKLPLRSPGPIGRLLGRRPKGNAFREFYNLVCDAKDLREVSEESIQDLVQRWGVDPRVRYRGRMEHLFADVTRRRGPFEDKDELLHFADLVKGPPPKSFTWRRSIYAVGIFVLIWLCVEVAAMSSGPYSRGGLFSELFDRSGVIRMLVVVVGFIALWVTSRGEVNYRRLTWGGMMVAFVPFVLLGNCSGQVVDGLDGFGVFSPGGGPMEVVTNGKHALPGVTSDGEEFHEYYLEFDDAASVEVPQEVFENHDEGDRLRIVFLSDALEYVMVDEARERMRWSLLGVVVWSILSGAAVVSASRAA